LRDTIKHTAITVTVARMEECPSFSTISMAERGRVTAKATVGMIKGRDTKKHAVEEEAGLLEHLK
jgi:hypothetical protein